jgi:phosphate:Na+ symporter
MPDLNSIKKDIALMAKQALDMWKSTHQAFMEHDLDLFPKILSEENKLNDLEKELTARLVELGRASASGEDKIQVTIYADVVGDLELIGDYCKDILERVQIKIEEKLLFSDEAVNEYGELYQKTEEALEEVVFALDKDSPEAVKTVLKKEEPVDVLVDEYRRRHDQRLIDGICSPMACNMFLNMLDFTAAVYHHTNRIAKRLLELK